MIAASEPRIVSAGRSGLLAASLLAFSATGCGGDEANDDDDDTCFINCPDNTDVEVYGVAPDDVIDEPSTRELDDPEGTPSDNDDVDEPEPDDTVEPETNDLQQVDPGAGIPAYGLPPDRR